MFHIAICDDEPRQLGLLENATKRYITEKAIPAQLQAFPHPDALLTAAARTPFDLFILDVCMPMLSGIQVGRELLTLGGAPHIVYVTTSPDYAVDAFALNAVHYLLKPFTDEQLFGALDRALEALSPGEGQYLLCQTESGVRRVPFAEIVYCESRGNYQHLHLLGGEILRARITSAALFEQLSKNRAFTRCGNGYIVSLRRIRNLTAQEAELTDGGRLPVPRRVYPELRRQYLDYYFKEETT